MPATTMPAPGPPARLLRLGAIGLAALFLAAFVAAWPGAVVAADLSPKITSVRYAQEYWEARMRAADADVQRYRAAQRAAERSVKATRARLARTLERRAKAKRALRASRKDLHVARTALAEAELGTPPPPDPATAALALATYAPAVDAINDRAPGLDRADEPKREEPAMTGTSLLEPAARANDVKRLERAAKEQKRTFKKAKRKARRAGDRARLAHNRLAAARAGERAAISRRESAEGSLAAWILTMERYGRIRAIKKSKVRPGVDSPFAWPARGRITQYYGRSHDGLDIASYKGTPIRAAAFGVVSYIGWNPWDENGRAFMIVVTHASGYETLYGHVMPRRSVRVGQEVKRGELIGYMGNTGKSTGPHLHFELRRGRTTVNPLGHL